MAHHLEFRRITSHAKNGAVSDEAPHAIKELPRGYRTIFLLHEVQGYDHQEIAEMLGCCAGNSKSQLHKAKLRIRERLARSPKAGTQLLELLGHAPNQQGHLRSGGCPSGGV